MKKIISILLVLVLLLPMCASAEKTETKKKNAFEFCDLYTYHLQEIKKKGWGDATHDFSGYNSYRAMPQFFEGEYYVHIPAGTLRISVPDFDLIGLEVRYASLDGTDEDFHINFLRAVAAFASLEYNSIDISMYPHLHKLDKSYPATVLDAAFNTFSEAVEKTIYDEKSMLYLMSENYNEIPFFSGNYNYSLRYYEVKDIGENVPDMEWIELVAECK